MVVNALLWLKQNNKYYRKIKIGNDALKLLPEDGQLTNLTTVMMKMRIDVDDQSTAKGQEENTSTSVVPILDSKLTENDISEILWRKGSQPCHGLQSARFQLMNLELRVHFLCISNIVSHR